jgi:spoIIIJ-associated protein
MLMEPMPANERRIIHLKLRDDPDVYTESIGEGSGRRVEVLPSD